MLFRFFDIYPCKNRVASAKMRSMWNTVIDTEIRPFCMYQFRTHPFIKALQRPKALQRN